MNLMTHFLASFVKAAFLRTWQTLRSRMLAGRPCHVTSRRITSETYFGITSDHVCHYYERGIYTNLYPAYYPLVSWPFWGRAARARPELNSLGLFLVSLSLNANKHTTAKRSSRNAVQRLLVVLKLQSLKSASFTFFFLCSSYNQVRRVFYSC
jgi:hypothetical protein